MQNFPKFIFVITENDKIIHVSYVSFAAQFFFHKMVERVEIYVCKELAGEIPNRYSFLQC